MAINIAQQKMVENIFIDSIIIIKDIHLNYLKQKQRLLKKKKNILKD